MLAGDLPGSVPWTGAILWWWPACAPCAWTELHPGIDPQVIALSANDAVATAPTKRPILFFTGMNVAARLQGGKGKRATGSARKPADGEASDGTLGAA
jgi:hypothetical protein